MIDRAQIKQQFERMIAFWFDRVNHYEEGVLEIEETEYSIKLVHYHYKNPSVVMEFTGV